MDTELRKHLLDSYDLSPETLDRLLADIWALTGQTSEQWVQFRHQKLQSSGHHNDDIYKILQRELTTGRFAAPSFTLRQIRRMIYG